MYLILMALMSFVTSFAPLEQNVLNCIGIEENNVLGTPVEWPVVRDLPGNAVDKHFDIGDSGQVWITTSGHMLVFKETTEEANALEGFPKVIHPCGVYAVSPDDVDLLVETYDPDPTKGYNSWQEYWLATQEQKY